MEIKNHRNVFITERMRVKKFKAILPWLFWVSSLCRLSKRSFTFQSMLLKCGKEDSKSSLVIFGKTFVCHCSAAATQTTTTELKGKPTYKISSDTSVLSGVRRGSSRPSLVTLNAGWAFFKLEEQQELCSQIWALSESLHLQLSQQKACENEMRGTKRERRKLKKDLSHSPSHYWPDSMFY